MSCCSVLDYNVNENDPVISITQGVFYVRMAWKLGNLYSWAKKTKSILKGRTLGRRTMLIRSRYITGALFLELCSDNSNDNEFDN